MSSGTKKCSALTVAEYFLATAAKEKKEITNKKLQKLLYYSQVWSLVLCGEKLFKERMEAWVHGPSVPVVYRKFKSFGFTPIALTTSECVFPFSATQKAVLADVWKVYGKYDANYLEALSHSELPWQEARKDLSPSEPSSTIISLATAKKYYAKKLEECSS